MTTGEGGVAHAGVKVPNSIATRAGGVRTAAELLLELATPGELADVIERLQQRLTELRAAEPTAERNTSGAGAPAEKHRDLEENLDPKRVQTDGLVGSCNA